MGEVSELRCTTTDSATVWRLILTEKDAREMSSDQLASFQVGLRLITEALAPPIKPLRPG